LLKPALAALERGRRSVRGESFEEAVLATEQAVDRRMHAYIDAMLDGRGLFAASELERRYPGIQAIAYAERVPLEERGAYARRIRDEGFPSSELRPAGERYEYFPLTYVAPFEGSNRPLFGYGPYPDRVNRDAMEQARDTRLPRASGKVDLETTGASWEPSFVVYPPSTATALRSGPLMNAARRCRGS